MGCSWGACAAGGHPSALDREAAVTILSKSFAASSALARDLGIVPSPPFQILLEGIVVARDLDEGRAPTGS
jgi:hypothetical protein